MRQCLSCPRLGQCRVPHDLARFDRVVHRLEQQDRAPLLRDRLHHYMRSDCLVEAGVVKN